MQSAVDVMYVANEYTKDSTTAVAVRDTAHMGELTWQGAASTQTGCVPMRNHPRWGMVVSAGSH